jgi:very-long-chain enoyl-CoA reductase
MSSFTLKVHNRNLPAANNATSSPYPLTLSFSSEPTLLEVKKAIQAQVPKLTPDRQRITTGDKKPLLDDRAKSGAKSGDDLYVKDLGPQIGWRTVFLIEYFGPIFIHPLFFLASQKYYGSYEVSDVQIVAVALVIAHYLKREYETVFVHRFSSGTMPLFNVFKNSAHYWILSGVLLAASIYRPAYGAKALKGTSQTSAVYLTSCAVVWTIAELANFRCHVILRNLRSEGGRERKIPRGFAFEYVVSLKHVIGALVKRVRL